MKNRYIEHAHISERKFRAILHHFAHDICVIKASALLGIRRQSVSRIYGLLRQRLLVLSIEEFRPFAGEVEIDESYFAPRRAQGRFGRGTAKVPVLGLHKRGDRVYVSIVKNCSMRELMPVVEGRVLSQSDVYTDTWSAYAGLVKSGYVNANNEIIGPFCLSTIDAFYAEGIISLYTQVIREFGKDFQPYHDIFTDSTLRMP